jgi:tetratricopeptide (TPR) repeat protein
MRRRDFAAAAEHYARAVEQSPRNIEARLMEALALLRSGEGRRALERLQKAHAAFPEAPLVTEALARLRAAAPNPDLRDGERAVVLAEALYQAYPTVEPAETLAMAYAQLGEYESAVSTQERTIRAAVQYGRADLLPRLQENLERYRREQPCPEPWSPDDPLYRPGRLAEIAR